MRYSIELTNQAQKDIRRLQRSIKQRIRNALNRLAENPRLGKSLYWQFSGFWSFRVGNYRIIYEIDDDNNLISVIHIGTRQHIYNWLEHWLRR